MQEIISSRHNPTIVKIFKLSDKKHREAEGLFRFDGVKLCAEAIMSGVELEYIFLRRDNSDAVRLRVAELCGKELRLSSDIPPYGAFAVILN